MGVKVNVVSTPKNRISINNQQRKTVRTVGVGVLGTGGVDELVELNDVDASDLDNNETLVYDESSGKFVVKVIPIINGGTF